MRDSPTFYLMFLPLELYSEAFKNVVRRLLEASGRGMWDADDETIEKLKSLYADADDLVSHRNSSESSVPPVLTSIYSLLLFLIRWSKLLLHLDEKGT